MSFTKFSKAAVLAVSLIAAGVANAGIIAVDSAAALAGKGKIAQVTNFDAYPSGRGDATFVSGGLLDRAISVAAQDYDFIARPNLGDRTLITGGGGTYATLEFAGEYSLFGFAAGSFGDAVAASFQVVTNLGRYNIDQQILAAYEGLNFLGFQADAGEHFVAVTWVGADAVGLTDIALGTVQELAEIPSEVPEPTSIALMLAGVAAAGMSRRKKQ